MSGLRFHMAKRSAMKPLIGLYSESGCGKTWSALMLARGFVGPKGRIAMIETEAGRGEAYADLLPGGYEALSLAGDFSPRTYGEAITVAEEAKYDALIVDSASHEWEGTGGVLHMAAMNMDEGKKGMQVWQTPKMDHARHFMLRLLQTPIPLVIVCMRAKYPMTEAINPKTGKKELVRSEQLEPKQSEDILYEIFVHGWIDQEHRFRATKYTRPDLAQVIPDMQPISIATGEALARWAAGGAAADPSPLAAAPTEPRTALAILREINGATSLKQLREIYDRLKAPGSGGGLDRQEAEQVRAAMQARTNELTLREPGAT